MRRQCRIDAAVVLCLVLCLVLQASASLAAPTKPIHPVVEAANRFGAKLLAEIHRASPEENVFISPASIALALGVAWSGAAGETRLEMGRCLGIGGLGLDSVQTATSGLLRSIHRTDPGIELQIATSLWVASGMTLRPDFIERSAKAYEADIVQLRPGDTAERIDAWVRQKTRGKIDALVEELPPELALVILNAVYFNGAWDEEFDAKKTQERPFHLPDGGIEHLLMMSRSGTFPYLQGPGFRAAALAYEGDMMRMVVALPDKASSLSALVESLAGETGWDWVQQLTSARGEVVLPRFTLAYDVTLNDVLKRLGMKQAFQPELADFSAMADVRPLWISRVRHKSWVEVSERGTEAAAATAVEYSLADLVITPGEPFRLVVDRPFLCVVRDQVTGLVLFLGAVTHPQRL